MTGTMFIQPASLASLPTTGAPFTALTSKATADPGSGNLALIDQSHPLDTFSIALYAAKMNDAAKKALVINEIKAVMGTESGAPQPLNPYRTIGAYVMAANLVDMPGSTVGANGQTFNAWLQSLPNKVIPGQANWNTLVKCAGNSGNNWGACARTSLFAVLLWLKKEGLQPSGADRETLIATTIKNFKRFVGDESAANSFAATGSFQSSWAIAAYPSAQGVINDPASTVVRSGVQLAGANCEDASRSTFPDKNGAGKHYQFESLDSASTFTILAINAGYSDAASWGGQGVRGNYKYFINNAITAPDADFHHFMWMQPAFANWLYPGLGFPVPSGWLSDRAQRRMLTTHIDWLTATGSAASTWVKVAGSGGGGGGGGGGGVVVTNPTITDLTFAVTGQSILVAAVSTAGSGTITGYTFHWGDGTTTGPQASSSASHAYTITAARTFAVTVDAVADDGGTATRTETSPTIFAADNAPFARVVLTKTSDVGPTTIGYDMTGSQDPDGSPLTYLLTSGDGETHTTATGTLTYAAVTEPTTYTVTGTVTSGGITSAPVVITVTILPPITTDTVGTPYLVIGGRKYLIGGGIPGDANSLHLIDQGADPSKDGLRIYGAPGAGTGQILQVFDYLGQPIFSIPVAGGPAVYGDDFRVLSGSDIFNAETALRNDGTIQVRKGDPGGGVGVLAIGAATSPPGHDPDGSVNAYGADVILSNVLYVDSAGRLWSRRGSGPTDLMGGAVQSLFPPTVGNQPGDDWFNSGSGSRNFYDGTQWRRLGVDIRLKRVITANYTLVNADSFGIVLHSTAASAITITLPSDTAATGIPQEVEIPWRQYGAGQITFAAGSGATLLTQGTKVKSTGQYAEGKITKTDVSTYVVSGNTST